MSYDKNVIEQAFDELEVNTDLDAVVDDAYFEPDAHSCRAEADMYGYCTVCGAVIYGSSAYLEMTGSDPWGTW